MLKVYFSNRKMTSVYCLPRKDVLVFRILSDLFHDCKDETREFIRKCLHKSDDPVMVRFFLLCSQFTNTGRFALTFNRALDEALKTKNIDECKELIQNDLDVNFPEVYDNTELTPFEKDEIVKVVNREFLTMELLFERALEEEHAKLFPCQDRNLYSCVFKEVCDVEFNGREDYFMLCGGEVLPSTVSLRIHGEIREFDLFDILPQLLNDTKLPNVDLLRQKYKIELLLFKRFMQK